MNEKVDWSLFISVFKDVATIIAYLFIPSILFFVLITFSEVAKYAFLSAFTPYVILL